MDFLLANEALLLDFCEMSRKSRRRPFHAYLGGWTEQADPMRLGIDLGGTKTEILALDGAREVLRRRIATPRGYDAAIAAIQALVAESGVDAPVGVGIPGTATEAGTIKNANSTWLNGRPAARRPGSGAGARACGWPMTPTASPCRKPQMAPARARAWCSE